MDFDVEDDSLTLARAIVVPLSAAGGPPAVPGLALGPSESSSPSKPELASGSPRRVVGR
jgi:hypothetical protein